MEPRINEPLYNELLGLTKDFHQLGQNYSKMYGTEPTNLDLTNILVVSPKIR